MRAAAVKHGKGVVSIPLDDASRYGLVTAAGLGRPASVTEDVANRLVTAIAVGRLLAGRAAAVGARAGHAARGQPGHRAPGAAAGGRARPRRRPARAQRRARSSRPQAWEDVAPDEARRTLETELPRLRGPVRLPLPGRGPDRPRRRRAPDGRSSAVELQEALAAFATTGEDMALARAWDRRLHGLVCAAAANPHLTALSAHLTAAATLGFGAEPYEPEFFHQALHEHERAGRRRRRRGRRAGPADRPRPLRADLPDDGAQPAAGRRALSALPELCFSSAA